MTEGYPLSDINKVLGKTNEICSILEPTDDEENLMAFIWDNEFSEDYPDEVVEAMNAHMIEGKKIFWENLYKRDVASRKEKKKEIQKKVVEDESEKRAENAFPPPPPNMFRELKDIMEVGFGHKCEMMEMLEEKINVIDERVNVLKIDMKTLQKNINGKEKVLDDDSVFFNYYQKMGEGTSAQPWTSPA